jgi:hypothetical protein
MKGNYFPSYLCEYKNLLVVLLCLLGHLSTGQTIESEFRFGGRVGVSLQIGQPVMRIGGHLALFLSKDSWEWNGRTALFYHLSRLGPPGKGPEFQVSGGLRLGLDPTDHDLDYHPDWPQLARKYTAAYQINYYKDQISTSQWTGTFGLTAGSFGFQMENDALAPGKVRDRFRTGAFGFYWREGEQLFNLQVVLWHGETRCAEAANQRQSNYRGRFGYRDFSGCRYANFSHGILKAGYQRHLGYGHWAQAELGVDAEQVRHVFQNILVHNMWWVPKKWTTVRNPHYPMLDQQGKPYLFEEGQEVRAPQWVWGIGANEMGFY